MDNSEIKQENTCENCGCKIKTGKFCALYCQNEKKKEESQKFISSLSPIEASILKEFLRFYPVSSSRFHRREFTKGKSALDGDGMKLQKHLAKHHLAPGVLKRYAEIEVCFSADQIGEASQKEIVSVK